MYLKRLELQGFKSFVDKTTLDFSDGITAVVGPNGSGKSNIADAVRWVLGEQRAKSLRGGKMEDVIFVGTENRRPVSFAEVSLTLDNSHGFLPIDFEEVNVTRRLYRSGESEYLINKSVCRLKDIHQLFLDTGIGVDGYSVIGQGKVDEILSGKPEERRAIFEEASGIMKYKERKMESERKLELTAQNIERINDIISELELQIDPLSEQASVAKKFLDYKYELRGYEISFSVDSIVKIRNQIDEFGSKDAEIKAEIDNQNTMLEKVKTDNVTKNQRFKVLDDKLNDSRDEYYEIEKQLNGFFNEINSIEEKISNLTSENLKISENVKGTENKINTSSETLLSIEADTKSLDETYNTSKGNLKELEDKYNYILSLMTKTSQDVEELRKKQSVANDRYNDKKLQKDRILSQINLYDKRKEELASKFVEYDNKKLELESLNKSSLDEEERLQNQLSDVSEKLSKLRSNKTENEDALDKIRVKESNIRNTYHQKSSELKVLKEMEENFEGYNRTVREVLSLAGRGASFAKGIKGAVAQLIEVDKKYEVAIDTALGQAAQNIVTENEENARTVIEHLRKNKLGRATFLPMTSIKGSTFNKSITDSFSSIKGYVGLAHELVSYESQYDNIMLSLLGKVVIVDNLENAIYFSKKSNVSAKIITLEGDIIRTSGAITGGSIDKGFRSGVLGRSQTIKELEEETKKLDGDLKDCLGKINDLIIESKSYINEINKLDGEKSKLDIQIVEVKGNIKRLNEKINEVISMTQISQVEVKEVNTKCDEANEDLTKLDSEILEIEQEQAQIIEDIQKLETENHTGRTTVDAMNENLTEKKLEVNNLMHEINTNKDNINRLNSDISEMTKSIEERRIEIENNKNDISELKLKVEGLNKAIKSHTERKTGQNLQIEKILEEKNTLNQELSEMMEKNTAISQQIYNLQEEYNRLEVKKSKLESEEENYINKLWDDYEVTFNNAMELIKDKDFGSLTFRQKKVAELKNLIKDLGPVNVNAIDDYKSTKERLEFMSNQRNDMEESKVKLEKVISDMTRIMKKQFLEQFEKINESFQKTFVELFDGGSANVRLADESDVLSCVIEIEAQPPGKKLQNMNLLSGGERSLTAIALLFAILKLKPTPFCILDEIEAALDDANVYKFAEFLKNFSSKSQFVVITHRKGTMESADTLYGVTMEEKGISKVVSMKL